MHHRPAARLILLIALVLLLAAPASAAPRLEPVGTFTSPVYVTAPPGDGSRLFVVEKAGVIKLISGAGASTTFLDIRGEVDPDGEEGLLSMAFAPDYATSRRFYVYFTASDRTQDPGSMLKIVEFKRSAEDPDVADPGSRRELLAIPHPGASSHNGGQLQFGPDGLLYAGTGDGGGTNDPGNNAQSPSSLLGKLLRIDPAAPPGAAEVWASGLRNPWRFSFDRETGDLVIGDVGQGLREEIDFLPSGTGPGANFGWRCFEGKVDSPGAPECTPPVPPGYVPPVFDYDSSGSFCGITGGYVVRDAALLSLRGRYLYADLCNPNLRSITLPAAGDDRAESLAPPAPAVSFGEDSCGHVYVASLSGQVNRIDEEPVTPCPVTQPPKVATDPPPPADQPPPAPADTAAPVLSVDRARRQRLVAAKGLFVGVRCDEPCGLTIEWNARLVQAGGTKRWMFPRRSELGVAGERRRLKLKISNASRASLRKRVAGGAKPLVTAVLIARDAAGNESRRTVHVRVVG